MAGKSQRSDIPKRELVALHAGKCYHLWPTIGLLNTNRQRHLKCDEFKPNCRRCRKDGKNCQGYQSIHTICFEVLDGIEEKRSYFYFFDVVAPALSGHHEEVNTAVLSIHRRAHKVVEVLEFNHQTTRW